MNAPVSESFLSPLWQARWQRFSAGFLRCFHLYANWLVSISWRRFTVLAVLFIAAMAILHDLPPFTWVITEKTDVAPRAVVITPRPPRPAEPAQKPAPVAPPAAPQTPGQTAPAGEVGKGAGLDIRIGKDGVHITPKQSDAERAAADAKRAAADADRAAARAAELAASGAADIRISLPPGASADVVREAIAEARKQIEAAVREARDDAQQAARDAAEAKRDVEQAIEEAAQALPRSRTRTTRVGVGDTLMNMALLWVLASLIIKITYKGRMQAEVKAAQATETAEAESLKRQVVEARMAAMQAQVEPHFLFNTLASIDHLIETDPARASVMQKNLIALLRASMPTMREASDGGVRDLGRELTMIRPYLEILKVRMEERMAMQIDVPDGLLSAEFPPMMVQTLVENAIKHGLEPKPEGGLLRVAAEIVHGKLVVTVADTGLGFGRAATAGTGVGLANIRERLQLLYGNKASLTVTENKPSGTAVTVTVPYKPIEGAGV